MPSSATPRPASIETATSALAAGGPDALHRPDGPGFHVLPFRRTADGAIVPGAAVEVTNGDIAWRWAMAAASDHANVGAIAFRGADAMLTSFGEVDLGVLRH